MENLHHLPAVLQDDFTEACSFLYSVDLQYLVGGGGLIAYETEVFG